MKTKLATDLFNDWAIKGKDKGMEEGHSSSADRMIEIAHEKIFNKKFKFSVLDVGCGNGWMIRKILSTFQGSTGLGVDGSVNMIKNAIDRDPSGDYLCVDLNTWGSSKKFDLIISMEVIYYLKEPQKFIKSLFKNSLNKGGGIIVGMDHYQENTQSQSWPGDLNVHMNTLSINRWLDMFTMAGFSNVEYEQFNKKKNWAGTLIISGISSK